VPDVDEILTWTTIVVGLILSGAGMKATWYFHRQHILLEGNWVLSAIFRTSATITAACLVLTLNRVWMMVFGPNVWSLALSGVMIAWILLIPWFLFRTFVQKEGAPAAGETAIQREDREVGNERRDRQSANRE
jgi:hypothetical protein